MRRPPGAGACAVSLLAQQQTALLDALFAWPQEPAQANFFTGARGLAAYRANGHALAGRTLQAAYPVVAQLLGEENFDGMAREFWHAHPPLHGDLAHWGDALPGFLQANPQLESEPYLGDVARVEWALHQAAGAPDREPDLASFALLSSKEPDALTLVLSAGLCVIDSAYPVASIVTAHLEGAPSLAEAGARLRARASESALVWRQGLRPRVRFCDKPEAALLRALGSGAALSAALDLAEGLDFNLWLPNAVQSGLVTGAATRVTAG